MKLSTTGRRSLNTLARVTSRPSARVSTTAGRAISTVRARTGAPDALCVAAPIMSALALAEGGSKPTARKPTANTAGSEDWRVWQRPDGITRSPLLNRQLHASDSCAGARRALQRLRPFLPGRYSAATRLNIMAYRPVSASVRDRAFPPRHGPDYGNPYAESAALPTTIVFATSASLCAGATLIRHTVRT